MVDQAKNIDLNKLGAQAQEKLKGLGLVGRAAGSRRADGEGAPEQASPVGELLKDVQNGP